ncbi:hypothetical protein ACFFF5_18010 [Lederbergia wuyishanensis]|uniref:ATP synthase F0 subunit 8 n=1 Tax=Lederbergia wuyishanensis TaxID=1347903 RepID=A0ABU0D4K3_9BACI|nr:hypothetical protein [Lederbergia wuyishanensis]MCJ8008078.1 hypothetical protein [Lederbergia wuyishanensis]MDQ0343337.1 hypothetical protein [Lederbergia wuyishanensis]
MWWTIGIMFCLMTVIALTAIITAHMRSSSKIKGKFIQDQLELEKMKHKNYLLETEKMKLELERMQLENPKEEVFKV